MAEMDKWIKEQLKKAIKKSRLKGAGKRLVTNKTLLILLILLQRKIFIK